MKPDLTIYQSRAAEAEVLLIGVVDHCHIQVVIIRYGKVLDLFYELLYKLLQLRVRIPEPVARGRLCA